MTPIEEAMKRQLELDMFGEDGESLTENQYRAVKCIVDERDELLSRVSDLGQSLKWAMDHVDGRFEDHVARIGCNHCRGIVPPKKRKGRIDDPIAHESFCPWAKASTLVRQMACSTCGGTGILAGDPTAPLDTPCPMCQEV